MERDSSVPASVTTAAASRRCSRSQGVIDGVALRTRAPVVFAATTGEEGSGDLRGAKELFATSMSGAAAAIALDGAGDERIVHRALGSRRFRIHFRGAGGHSWTAFGVPNAVHAAAL